MKWIFLFAVLCGAFLRETSALGCQRPTVCTVKSNCTQRHLDANSDVLSTLLIYECGKGKVCCPPVKLPSRIKRPHKNMKLFPEQCGSAITDKIIDGKAAKIGQFPWMALIGAWRKNEPPTQYICGGSVINSRYVLTAAHCVKTPETTIVHVRLGEHDLDNVKDCEQIGLTEFQCADPVSDVLVERILTHPLYIAATFKNDIALIRVKSPIVFSEFIQPICMPFSINDTGAEEKKYTVSGWGKLNARNAPQSPVLQYARVTGLSTPECNALQFRDATPLDASQMCADDAQGSDACQGDSGGPLIAIQRVAPKPLAHAYIIGIVSFGFRQCDQQNSPTAYTRVYYYLDWILDHIRP